MGILFGLFLSGFGSFMLWRSLRLRMKGLFTIGTITDVGFRTLVVHFKTTRNKSISFKLRAGKFIFISATYRVGASVPILYNPHNPKDAIIYSPSFMWMPPLFFVGMGVVIIYQVLMH